MLYRISDVVPDTTTAAADGSSSTTTIVIVVVAVVAVLLVGVGLFLRHRRTATKADAAAQ